MHIAVTGATGLVGGALLPALTEGGHRVTRIVRKNPGPHDVVWDPASGLFDAAPLEGVDVVVHLAGENISSARWNDEVKRKIRETRIEGTRVLATALARMSNKPRALISASAIGYYGDRGDEELDESSAPGQGFLAEVCRSWEAAAEPARAAGIRVVHPRFGVILSPKGGALAKMLTPFKLFVGGRMGSGRQWWSWVDLDDVVGALQHAAISDSLSGPMNVVAPNPARNAEFTKELGRALSRPTIFPMPAFAARSALGEMADELILASAHVAPRRLLDAGYRFHYPRLEDSLSRLVGS